MPQANTLLNDENATVEQLNQAGAMIDEELKIIEANLVNINAEFETADDARQTEIVTEIQKIQMKIKLLKDKRSQAQAKISRLNMVTELAQLQLAWVNVFDHCESLKRDMDKAQKDVQKAAESILKVLDRQKRIWDKLPIANKANHGRLFQDVIRGDVMMRAFVQMLVDHTEADVLNPGVLNNIWPHEARRVDPISVTLGDNYRKRIAVLAAEAGFNPETSKLEGL